MLKKTISFSLKCTFVSEIADIGVTNIETIVFEFSSAGADFVTNEVQPEVDQDLAMMDFMK